MDIASMLNAPPRPQSRVRDILTPPSAIQGGYTAPSSTLPTPSPEYIPGRHMSESRESRGRTPWDAGGYSLPLIPGPRYSSKSVLPFRSAGEHMDSAPLYGLASAAESHSRHGSIGSSLGSPVTRGLTPLDNSRSYAPISSTMDNQQDISRDRSINTRGHHRRDSSRSTFQADNPFAPLPTTGHKISDSRSSLSSYSSSSFSGGHSRISSMSTVSGGHASIDPKFEQEIRSASPRFRSMSRQSVPDGAPEMEANMRGGKRRRGHPSEDQRSNDVNSIKKHKRAISAPIPARRHKFLGFPEAAISPPLASNPASKIQLRRQILEFGREYDFQLGQPLRDGKICQFVQNCDTNSSPRKVISHIFGRNKVCTRRIPERVWVCMCRKHYQRIRYRKGPQYSITQVNLVYEQICRMIFWSLGCEVDKDANVEGITIQCWTFSIRKRELNRPSDQSTIPRWIIDRLGTGKSHEEILEIVQRLRSEVESKMLLELPPVEFLPEVIDSNPAARSSLPVAPVQMASPEDMEMSDSDGQSSYPRPSENLARNPRRRQQTWELQSHQVPSEYAQGAPLPTIDEPAPVPAYPTSSRYPDRIRVGSNSYDSYYDPRDMSGRVSNVYRHSERQSAIPSIPTEQESSIDTPTQIIDTSANEALSPASGHSGRRDQRRQANNDTYLARSAFPSIEHPDFPYYTHTREVGRTNEQPLPSLSMAVRLQDFDVYPARGANLGYAPGPRLRSMHPTLPRIAMNELNHPAYPMSTNMMSPAVSETQFKAPEAEMYTEDIENDLLRRNDHIAREDIVSSRAMGPTQHDGQSGAGGRV